ncbi:flavin-containing monooxygenase 1-like [Sitodiplosis mosellana]|uniref:flavin-containing monooxygenase 1-like n=1 Tax=Sitodiplosis mosellana TaxID=263140 RepID=UPI002444167A|nr:flavin-containing monooxygenase 1-like [Sitodiplosis mosellana]
MLGTIKTIAIIGAGPSGLCCVKNALEYGFEVTVYEQNSQVGGLWIYTDQIGNYEYGLPIHSSMYKGVVTNIPVESMGFFNYPFPKKEKSFVSHEEVLKFYQSYANQYNLNRVIKFRCHVVNVKPTPNNRWEVLSRDLRRNTYEIRVFDAIFVCNGHYNAPYIPNFEGIDEFRGNKAHSHDYRRPEKYQDETVLIIGCGPSGRDILHEVAPKAKKVFFSHHRNLAGYNMPSNVTQAGDVKCFKENSVQFEDDAEEQISCILFCTGYTFSFPFLSVDCGLSLQDMFLSWPLYKHLININKPTMAIVGLQICAYSYMYDLQARLCLKFWNGDIQLPTKKQMLEEFRIEKERRVEKGNDIRQSHLLGVDQAKYLQDLSNIGQMIKIPNVLLKIYDDCNELRTQYPNTYREYNYTIIDDETFERKHIPS